MTPTPQEPALVTEPDCSASDDEQIVITGMSGLYPDSHNIKELSDILYNKVNPVSAENSRWESDFPDAAQYMGKVPDLNLFDAQFFKVHYRLANCMDPMSRKILEHVYQAIYDAGINPQYLDGKKVAVFVGTSLSESERSFFQSTEKVAFGISGCSKTMFANRISYWLNVKGPSMSVDESCCSSIAALEQAFLAVKTGGCEAAIVAASNLFLYPHTTVHYKRLVNLAANGKTKSFDENADGFAMSDAINVLFVQKAKDARRIHAELKYVKTEYSSVVIGETGQKFGFNRYPQIAMQFIKQFYEEAGVSPKAVEYVEAFGSANNKADKNELEIIDGVFCENRPEPLLVGSVMSNIGYTGAACGVTAITKVLLAYHRGELAGNLHCTTPRRDVAALRDGRMRILTEHQPFRRTYTAVNSMSITGINAHVLLRGYYKIKDPAKYKASIPHLVTLSGRIESGVTKIIEDLKLRPVDPEEIALLHNIHTTNIPGHLGRGFVILDTNEEQNTISLGEAIDYFNEGQRPLWFVYSGMGSQWVGMGAQLMRIPIFAAAIERCRQALEPKGLDIVNIITSSEETMFDNIIHSFVGIAAIQIGLTDILRELGLVPDGIIGHSVGELGCGYADGCFTAEEMILSAYSRGLVSSQTPFIRGSMAAIGKGFSEISVICPPGIEVACHNGPDSCTISGPADLMREFVADLTAKSIFAKEVPCSNIAFHSRYISEAGPALLQYLKDVIKNPRPRSSRWVSTSVPQEQWDDPSAKYCSAEYHTNNLLRPVLFEETSQVIPSNAVVVEVAPHGLLQAILKRSLPTDCRHVPLTRRGHADNAVFLLQAIGKLHMEGFSPKVHTLYPVVEFPVSTGTPLLSHLVEWAHDEEWFLLKHLVPEKRTAATCNLLISPYEDDYSYLLGHVIGGNTVFPYAAILVAVWDTLVMWMGVAKKQLSVRFEDVYLFSQPIMHEQRQLKLTVSMQKGSKYFEIMDHNSKVASGFARELLSKQNKNAENREQNMHCDIAVDSNTVYHLLHDRGYSYKDGFRGIDSVNEDLSEGYLLWQNNWVTFLDSILQLNVLRRQHDSLSLVTYIESVAIDVAEHGEKMIQLANKTVLKAEVQEIENKTICGGVIIKGLKFRDFPSVVPECEGLQLINVATDNLFTNKTNTYLSVARNEKLQSGCVGEFDSLRWEETPEPTGSDVIVTVHYAGINNYDAGKASGEVPYKSEEYLDDNCFGMDFSGITQSGTRVMGIVSSGACSRRVRTRPELLWPVPAHWTLEDAATVPLAYALVFYCLNIKLRCSSVLAKTNILVHGGAGALGQAAISVALASGYEVFTTVSDVHKKQFLRKLFPEIKEEHIGNSRDHSFGDMVLAATNGKGCDIVISCVHGNLKNTSLKCCASSGVTIDTTQLLNQDIYTFGMHYLTKERNYIPTDFASILANGNIDDMKLLQGLVSEGVSRGWVRPLSRVTYAPHDAPRAFRLLAASQHRGRVLLDLTARTHTGTTNNISTGTAATQNRISCTPDLCQLLLCDGDTLSLQLADKLISYGARKVCIHCPTLNMYYRLKIQFWQKRGVQVNVFSEDLKKHNDVVALLNKTNQLGHIEGIYIFNTKYDLSEDLTSLVNDLDTTSRLLCPKIKHFGVINAGTFFGQQTCITRAQSNLPATMISLPNYRQIVPSCSELPSSSAPACWWSAAAVCVVERALTSGCPALTACTPHHDYEHEHECEHEREHEHAARDPLHALLTNVTNISNFSELQKHSSLHEIGIDREKIKATCTFLRNTYDISLREDELSKMQIEEIRELNASVMEFSQNRKSALESFFSYVDSDELLGTIDLVPLPSLANNVNDETIESIYEQTQLFIVPGLEGHHEKFRCLCERLKLPALVLQPGMDNNYETLQETAERYAKVILKKVESTDYFYLLGYESGVIVALEVAAILEKNGITGTVFCIGYSPEEFQRVLEASIDEFGSEDQVQDALIKHMFTIMADCGSCELEKTLHDISSWELKLNSCMQILMRRVTHSAQYTRSVIEAAYARIVQVRRYSAQLRPLRSQIVLLRAAGTRSPPAVSSLQQYSQQPVIVYELRSPLAHITRDLRCAAIINRHLRSDILEKFENKNLCDVYLTDLKK